MTERPYDPENAPIATSTRVPPADDGTDDEVDCDATGEDSDPIVPRTRTP